MLHFSVKLFSVASLMLKEMNFTCFSEKFAASLNGIYPTSYSDITQTADLFLLS